MGSDDLNQDLARAVAICSGEPVVGDGAPRAPGLIALQRRFGLSPLELEIARIALAVEIDPELALRHPEWGAAGRPSVATLQRVLAKGGDAAAVLVPGGHLARHGLIEWLGDGAFPTRAVRLPACFWPRLAGWPAVLPFASAPAGAVRMEQLAVSATTRQQLESLLERAAKRTQDPGLVSVIGAPGSGRELVAAALAGALGYAAISLDASALDDAELVPALLREVTWLGAAVVVDHAPAPSALTRLLLAIPTLVFVLTETALAPELGAVPRRWRSDLELVALSPDERVALWQRQLHGAALEPSVDLMRVVGRLGLGATQIAAAAALARRRAGDLGRALRGDDLRWATRRGQVHRSGLVQPLDTDLTLADVVIPAATRRELELARRWAEHAEHAFAAPAAGRPLRGDRGLVCLFYGPPGTGKTLAARALAGELGVELLRVDLSQVVSKYIGETEKNLAHVFEHAETTGAALFFDEADALFGKRSEVKDAHDRYANIETAFLLQRLEGHRGLCILASNLRQNLDDAFTRRIQILAEFPVPGAGERLQIWQRHLVAAELARDIELEAVARQFALAGGDIRNAAASALVMATAEAQQLAMRHLALAIWRELRKSGRLTTPDDFGPWRDLIVNHVR